MLCVECKGGGRVIVDAYSSDPCPVCHPQEALHRAKARAIGYAIWMLIILSLFVLGIN